MSILLALLMQACSPEPCFESPAERASMLQLAEDSFDQYNDRGWRLVSSRGGHCRIAAAELILEYIERRGEDDLILPYLAHWHAGQMFAMAGETSRALRQFRFSYVYDGGSRSDTLMCNEYVTGTIAFLENDRDTLIAARNAFPDESHMNRGVLDGLLACFEEPYSIACGGRCLDADSE